MYGIIINGDTDPYAVSDNRDAIDELLKTNRDRGHAAHLMVLDPDCVICSDTVEGWHDVSVNPVHDGPCVAEYEAWVYADMMED